MIKKGMVHEHYRKVILCEEDELSQEHAIQWHKKKGSKFPIEKLASFLFAYFNEYSSLMSE